MEYYAIDVTNPRIQKAMANLGIEDSELLQRSIEDFGGKDITDEIRKLRFNYFERKQQELVRQIKSFVKEDILRNREKVLKAKSIQKPVLETLITSLAEPSEDSFTKTKSNYKKIVDKTYFDVKEALNEKQAIEEKLKIGEKNRKQAQSAVSKTRTKIEEFKERQKENLQRIKERERKTLGIYYRNISSASPTRFRSINRLQVSKNSRSRSESLQELDIDEQILKYEEKMNKSKKLHELTILSKKNAAAKLLERKLKSPTQEMNLIEKISKLVAKNKTAQDRRFSHLRQLAESREKNREKHDERRQRAQSKLREQDVLEKKRSKDIEKKMKISSSLLQQKHHNWVKELALRSEMQRLKDEEALNNAERKRRIMRYKRENVLEKQISDSSRIEAIKKNKEETVKKKLEIAMKTMKEKEKLHEVLLNLRKTPESKIMGKKQFLESLYSI